MLVHNSEAITAVEKHVKDRKSFRS